MKPEAEPSKNSRFLFLTAVLSAVFSAGLYLIAYPIPHYGGSSNVLEHGFVLAAIFVGSTFLLAGIIVAFVESVGMRFLRSSKMPIVYANEEQACALVASIHSAGISVLLFAAFQSTISYFFIFKFHYKPLIITSVSLSAVVSGLFFIRFYQLIRINMIKVFSSLTIRKRDVRFVCSPSCAHYVWGEIFLIIVVGLCMVFKSTIEVVPPPLLFSAILFISAQCYLYLFLGPRSRFSMVNIAPPAWIYILLVLGGVTFMIYSWNYSMLVRQNIIENFRPGYIAIKGIVKITDRDKDGFSWLMYPQDINDKDASVNPIPWIASKGTMERAHAGSARLPQRSLPEYTVDGKMANALPNIFIFIVDSFVFELFDKNTAAGNITPNISSLAHEGILFSRAYSASTETGGGFPNIVAGFHGYPFGLLKSYNFINNIYKKKNIAATLHSMGYHATAFFAHAAIQEIVANMEGFETVTSLSTGDNYWDNIISSDRQVAMAAMQYLANTSRDKPYFVICAFEDTHWPWNPREPFRSRFGDRSTTDIRAATIAGTDDEIGHILKAIRSFSLWENSIIIVTGDHGDHNELTEKVLHVPLVMRFPQCKSPPIDTVVSIIDIAPTLYGAIGVDPGYSLPGYDLWPLIFGKRATRAPGGQQGVVSFNDGQDYQVALTEGDYRVRYNVITGHADLMRIIQRHDPGEVREDNPELLRTLLKKLLDSLKGRDSPYQYVQ